MSLGEELAALLSPLLDAFASPQGADALLRELGVLAGPGPAPAVPAQLADLAATAEAAIDAVLALQDPAVPAAERVAGLVTNLTGLADAIAALAELDEQAVAGFAAPFDVPELWPFLARVLPGYLLVRWLREWHRGAHDLLALAGAVGPGPDGPPTLDLARLGAALTQAAPWADALADLGVLVAPVRRHLDARGLSVGLPPVTVDPGDDTPDETVTAAGDQTELRIPGGPSATLSRAGGGLAVGVDGLDRLGKGIDLGGGWTLSGDGAAGSGGVVLGARSAAPLDGGTLDSASVELAGRPSAPWALLGDQGATRVELAAFSVGLAGTSLTRAPEVALTVSTSGLRLVVAPGDADSFLASLLGGEIVVELALAGRWSPEDGLSIDGAVGLSVHVTTTITLGPLTISGLTITVELDGDVLALVLTTEIGGAVGPVSASVTGMGLRTRLLPGTERGAGIVPLGPAALAVAFEPPSGASIGIDLGAAGGGWIGFDQALGRYAGVIELRLLGVGICAVVLIDTAGGGGESWSMFFALFIDLPAIQLGFGFTLTGVGGLFGFNRTLDTVALGSAVRSGSLESVLFPPDPVGEAPELIAELSALFPRSDGRYVLGPVVRLAWGTPSLIEAELGIVLSLPDPVVITVLGSVNAVLPFEDLDLIAFHLDVAGVIDEGQGTLSIDASLHDSHVVGFPLAGGMAVRAAFLDQPTFLMALGGSHPGFEAPDGFPTLARLSLAISAAPVIDISFECYFAIASNSVQFGASFHLSAEVAGFGVEGGASFDALIDFSPLRLATRLGWYVSVTAAGADLAGVWLDASVEGPNPWLVVGTARFKLLGLEEHVRIDEQIGAKAAEDTVDPADLLAELAAALAEEGAWSVAAGTSPGVVVTAAGDEDLAVPPDGVLAVSQRAVPLDIHIDKAGDAPVADHDTFSVEPAAGSLASTGVVRDWFAPGYFFDLGHGEQLSAPSFEQLAAGIEFGGGDPLAGPGRAGTLEFEEIVRDPELGQPDVANGTVDLGARPELVAAMAGAASAAFDVADDLDRVSLARSSYAVTNRDTGRVQARAGTWSAAHQSAAGRRDATTVVPSWEAPA
jgi:hypothetical protein